MEVKFGIGWMMIGGGDFDTGYAPDYFIKTGTSGPVVEYCSF